MTADDLVARLRRHGDLYPVPRMAMESLSHAAADAIEARDAEIEALQTVVRDQSNIIGSLVDHKAHQNAEIEALRRLARFVHETWSPVGFDRMAVVAFYQANPHVEAAIERALADTEGDTR